MALFLAIASTVLMAWQLRPWAMLMLWVPIGAALLVGIAASLWCAFQRTRQRPFKRALLLAFIALSVAILLGAAMFANRLWYDRAVREACAYPEKVAPFMQEYFRANHRYPESWQNLPEVPWLLRRTAGYRSHGDAYAFDFDDPDVPWDEWHYASERGEWEVLN